MMLQLFTPLPWYSAGNYFSVRTGIASVISNELIDFSFALQVLLLSEDYGKHLMGVEDLLQKHALLEADVAAYGDQVKEVNAHVAKYMEPEGPDGSGLSKVFLMHVTKMKKLHCMAAARTNKK